MNLWMKCICWLVFVSVFCFFIVCEGEIDLFEDFMDMVVPDNGILDIVMFLSDTILLLMECF